MPDAPWHQDKARHNEAFLTTIDLADGNFLDWAVTVLFYVSLHLVDALLANNNEHFKNHVVRNKKVPNVLQPPYSDYYLELYNDSRLARYESAFNITQADYDNLVHHRFQLLKAELERLLT